MQITFLLSIMHYKYKGMFTSWKGFKSSDFSFLKNRVRGYYNFILFVILTNTYNKIPNTAQTFNLM